MKTIGRIYVRNVQDLPEHVYNMVFHCNQGTAGNMQYQIKMAKQERRKLLVAYVMHNRVVIGAGILFGPALVKEFQVYVKPYYRNIGLGTRLYNRLREYSRNRPYVHNGVSPKTMYFFDRLGYRHRCARKPKSADEMKNRARERLSL